MSNLKPVENWKDWSEEKIKAAILDNIDMANVYQQNIQVLRQELVIRMDTAKKQEVKKPEEKKK